MTRRNGHPGGSAGCVFATVGTTRFDELVEALDSKVCALACIVKRAPSLRRVCCVICWVAHAPALQWFQESSGLTLQNRQCRRHCGRVASASSPYSAARARASPPSAQVLVCLRMSVYVSSMRIRLRKYTYIVRLFISIQRIYVII